MDISGRSARSRTSSTSSLTGNPATPSHTPTVAYANARQEQGHALSPEQLSAGLTRVRVEQGYASSSVPSTPAPTPNPQLQVSYHLGPEQLAAGISSLRADEGYVESTSFPATPAPSPFSPSPAQFSGFSPDQVAEGIRRLREEGTGTSLSGTSTGQPPTPSTTPGPGGLLAAAAFLPGGVLAGAGQQLGIIPEHLAESIEHLRYDEGLESGSNPATPVPTPISPLQGGQHRAHILFPEQLAAGIHRLKVEEGMSSGGSSGFPSTPAPTPFVHSSGGGVRPEDLAAGISKLSVIEEGEVAGQPASSLHDESDLSRYFGAGDVTARSTTDSFFDQLNESSTDAVLHSCRESTVNLNILDGDQGKEKAEVSSQEKASEAAEEAKIEVEQKFDDAESLHIRRRQSGDGNGRSRNPSESVHQSLAKTPTGEPVVCTLFREVKEESDPFQNIAIQHEAVAGVSVPSSLALAAEEPSSSSSTAIHSVYETPVGGTPMSELGYSTYAQSQTLRQSGSPVQQLLSPMLPQATHLVPTSASRPLPPALASQFSIDDELTLLETAALEQQSPEANRRNEAWIPKQATAQILSSMSASTPGTYYPDRSSLTAPGISINEDLLDPIRSLVAHYRGESEVIKRQVLGVESVTQDARGLRQLVKAGCFRAALNLTSRLLQMYHQGPGQRGGMSKHTPSSLQIWYTRISLLVKLKQFSVAEVEAEPFGDLDRPDLYFQFYPEMHPNRRGSMVPFAFRVVVAELPQYLGKMHESLDRLYALLKTTRKIIDNLSKGKAEDGSVSALSEEDRRESLSLWKSREVMVLCSLANSAILQKDFDLAVTNLTALLERESEKRKPKVISALGRVFLQLGDLENAQQSFSRALELRQADVDAATANERNCDTLLDVAFLSMANSDFLGALATLQQAESVRPGDPMIINNIAVCYLYVGKLKDGLSYLESRLTANPALMLQDTVVLNLCTLYELESSYAGQKKRSLLDLVSQYKGDGFNASCLKLQM